MNAQQIAKVDALFQNYCIKYRNRANAPLASVDAWDAWSSALYAVAADALRDDNGFVSYYDVKALCRDLIAQHGWDVVK